MTGRIKEILHSRSGFTRMQNLMIFVLLAVIVLVGSYAFTGYCRASYAVKADHTAERAYGIAKAYLSDMKSAGKLEDFNVKALKYGGVLSLEQQEASLESRYEGSDYETFIEKYRKKYKNVPVCYLLLESEKASGEERSSNPILTMFEYQMVDENITKHTFLIEYNGNTGEVLSVFYSEKADTFTYEGDREDRKNVVLRDRESLKQKWQGYYGVDLEEL